MVVWVDGVHGHLVKDLKGGVVDALEPGEGHHAEGTDHVIAREHADAVLHRDVALRIGDGGGVGRDEVLDVLEVACDDVAAVQLKDVGNAAEDIRQHGLEGELDRLWDVGTIHHDEHRVVPLHLADAAAGGVDADIGRSHHHQGVRQHAGDAVGAGVARRAGEVIRCRAQRQGHQLVIVEGRRAVLHHHVGRGDAVQVYLRGRGEADGYPQRTGAEHRRW